MNNDILISIRPKWVEKIIHGIKKAELRKGWLNCCEGTKFYIYCTKGSLLNISMKSDDFHMANGKVVGEFICNKIYHYEAEFWNDNCYEEIRRIWIDDDGEEDFYIETENGKDNPSDCDVCRLSCLTFDEIKEYIGEGWGKKFSLIMISDLKIYDRPKSIRDFCSTKVCPQAEYNELNDCWTCKEGDTDDAVMCKDNGECIYFDCPRCPGENYEYEDYAYCTCDGYKPLTRAPQSWQYVKACGGNDED